jgi:hypothetical protein
VSSSRAVRPMTAHGQQQELLEGVLTPLDVVDTVLPHVRLAKMEETAS